MNQLDNIRSTWDNMYRPIITKIIGVIMTFFGFKFILETGPFEDQTGMIIAAVAAVLYFYSPGAAGFVLCCLYFICTAHIHIVAVLIIAAIMLYFCACNYMQVALAVITPLCMSFTGTFELAYWGIFVLFIYFSAKGGDKAGAAIYSAYFTLLMMIMGKFGLMHIFYKKPVKWVKSEVESVEEFFNTIDMKDGFNYFAENNLTNAIMILAVIIIAAQILNLIFSNKKLFGRMPSMDVRELILFAISMVVMIAVNVVFVQILKIDCGNHYGAMILFTLLAYIVSRPFASDRIIKTFITKDQKTSGGEENQIREAVIPKDSWADIAGYENTKAEIRETIKPYIDKEEYRKMQMANMNPIKGILLFGPPGTGKTSIARAIANETNMKLFVVNAGEFVNKYVGESEKALREIFDNAKNAAPAIICFDEIESFLARRSDESKSYEKNIITTFLSQMDGFNELKNVLVVGTTNKPNLIDEAALRPGRFDKVIYVGAPNEAARKALFRKYLNKKANLDLIDIDRLVDNSDRYTGADIKGVCEEAYRSNGYAQLTEENILDQLKKIRPSFTLDMKDEYYKWSKRYNRSSMSEQDYTQKKKKSLSWDDIKGMGELKEVLKKKIENPIKNMDKYREYNIPVSKGILFFGPPGCGKTFFAKVVADECDTAFFTINGPELLGGKIGESEKNLRKVFRDARETKPAIIFFDEIDAMAEKRDSAAGGVRLVNQLLTEMDGMESLDGVIVIAATNRPDALDPALMRAGRFDTKIYIGMPDEEAKRDMLKSALKDIPNQLDFEDCAAKLQNYSCADITGVANKVKEFFVTRSINEGVDKAVDAGDFAEIVKTTKASVSEEDLRKYNEMKELQSIM